MIAFVILEVAHQFTRFVKTVGQQVTKYFFPFFLVHFLIPKILQSPSNPDLLENTHGNQDWARRNEDHSVTVYQTAENHNKNIPDNHRLSSAWDLLIADTGQYIYSGA